MLDTQYSQYIQHRIDQKTKPLGALGLLEKVAHQLALIQSQGKEAAVEHIELNKPSIIIFAGDHGIADEGVSIAPSAVTQQMVLNFLSDGAAINCFCAVNNIDITVVDTGILLPVESDSDMLISQRLGTRTNNFANEAAMSLETVERGIELGTDLVSKTISNGTNIIMFGEMGIGNTSSASAILSALANRAAAECVGLGTGINNEQLARKVAVVEQGVARCKGLDANEVKDIKEVLAQVGGYEIVQMVGAFLGAYQNKTPVLVDGFIVSVAAYVATLIEPSCRDYMIFAHRSEESGHKILLELLDAEPLLDLGLRLGEGTGAALAMPIIRAAAEFYNNMASFESAGVTV
ncbi:nicotinate-nucleotide--dimethylbenzimidazole phosphoribosyltransferase [Vibrio sp. 10N.286.52.C3]|jgi:nicotinate-nucleotide--dimethylbenzimidazole phosphoribosyltransferase|uniref:nicotinate-nucleotide--dimethylbenzimidazole phosphoribosyltransferase n=1 Tax=Vibrio TaxID=662 RepID=UPI00030D8D86|nr:MULTISPECIES: nicotinate-nucleotide--dimethylbenzimidazole phosphoribosyltransferase [Vibrio]NOH94848.1 nicotinate-nucleotide--dimethylbenzimidazole phosphoribosyltransferase [Vibrio sp. AIC-3]OEE91658.1 nicotinate-nucleotide--dimethylbenzimidazole phosphoribosyltransferase [Vibrio crassostreae 9ZC88]OEF02997.1 nicotinate-nucleotide--dimethylbenzimidazole phosphoribosyltransferase [Vibrio crassostreae 9ZC13]TKF68526.1 nicotinate-nucleotide--dimethylbenzimidazole phosphoribosyltransferase [Vi